MISAEPRRLGPARRFALRFIETYQARVSARIGATCRFEPTCSEYGRQAYLRYSFVRATAKTVLRLLRCRGEVPAEPIVDRP